jgi:Porphyromonas-type peptidyl-arginine deiminase
MNHSCQIVRVFSAAQFVIATIKSCPRPPIKAVVGIDWRFNGWGDLYGSYEADKLLAAKLSEAQGAPYISTDFVLEGGSIHVDGEG